MQCKNQTPTLELTPTRDVCCFLQSGHLAAGPKCRLMTHLCHRPSIPCCSCELVSGYIKAFM